MRVRAAHRYRCCACLLTVVSSGTIVIVEPDPTVASIWTEVAAFAGFSAEVVSSIAPDIAKDDVRALVVRVSRDCCRVPPEWKTRLRPRLIALATPACAADLDLKDFDVVLPCDGQVHALYAVLHDLAHVAG